MGTPFLPPLSFARPTCLSPGRRSWSPREALCGGCGRHLRKSATRRDGQSGPQRVTRPPERTPVLRPGLVSGQSANGRPSVIAGPFLKHRTTPRHPTLSALLSPRDPSLPTAFRPPMWWSWQHTAPLSCRLVWPRGRGALASSLHGPPDPCPGPRLWERPEGGWMAQNLHLQPDLPPDSPCV